MIQVYDSKYDKLIIGAEVLYKNTTYTIEAIENGFIQLSNESDELTLECKNNEVLTYIIQYPKVDKDMGELFL